MWNAYCVVNHKKGRAEPSTADPCYAFNRFFTEQKSLERHLNCCAHIPRVVYRFENQSIQTFFDDTKFMLICRLPSILILKPLVIKNLPFWQWCKHIPCFVRLCGWTWIEHLWWEVLITHLNNWMMLAALFWSHNGTTTKGFLPGSLWKKGKVLDQPNVLLQAKVRDWSADKIACWKIL